MQSVEVRFVRHQVVKYVLSPTGTIVLPYGEPFFRPPRGTMCYVESAVAAAQNVAATRNLYLADGSQSLGDAMTDGISIATPAVPVSFNTLRVLRGLFVVSDALFVASTNIVTGETIMLRAQIGVYVPVTDDVVPSEFDEKHAEEPTEVAMVG